MGRVSLPGSINNTLYSDVSKLYLYSQSLIIKYDTYILDFKKKISVESSIVKKKVRKSRRFKKDIFPSLFIFSNTDLFKFPHLSLSLPGGI